MAEDIGERTQPATQRRRMEARQRGQFVQSRDLAAAVILLGATMGFHYLGESMLASAAEIMRYCFREAWIDLDVSRFRVEATKLVLATGLGLAGWMGLVLGVAFAYHFWQADGIQVAVRKSYINFGIFNPVGGLKKIFSLRSLVKTGIDLAKVSIVGWIAYDFFMEEMPALVSLTNMSFPEAAGYTGEKCLTLAYQLVLVLLVLGYLDWTYQRYQYEQDMKMTRQEVREEHKDLEGDPRIRAKRRRIQLQMALKRMMARVPEAEVVITNPTELAVAIKYDALRMEAPIVVAKGAGKIAGRIRELAALHRIPIVENKPLARLLFFKTEIERVIPEESFVAVAELLAYVYQITGKDIALSEEERRQRVGALDAKGRS